MNSSGTSARGCRAENLCQVNLELCCLDLDTQEVHELPPPVPGEELLPSLPIEDVALARQDGGGHAESDLLQ
eukprot:s407_g7.t1